MPDRSLTYNKTWNPRMPAQPAWYHRLDAILDTLRNMNSSYLDRRAIEQLFEVRERRARQIMAGLPGLQAGNAAAVSRLALIERLEAITTTGPFQWEIRRRLRVTQDLDQTRRQIAARQVRIPTPSDVQSQRLEGLPAEIEIRPGELRIAFVSAEGLAARLFELSQAMANDWTAFVAAVEPVPPSFP